MCAEAADLQTQLSAAEAQCEALRRSLAAAEGQLTSTKVAATHATMAAQVMVTRKCLTVVRPVVAGPTKLH